ncbi:DUF992 domain-containing protein [Rhizobiaceae bacterium BDR2-2]|uniref:DUF992 domain-containing protein n=1 Tax=Ectorhizobium quercum TaxID=2965071 RepID=A0AAE3SVU5_9HYPH|nr:DUF992 domain-containing protein [Ectorhizobium quercum]MCX8996760.1 DUF992 domain-containing protein [Ectorhizobium quercum]
MNSTKFLLTAALATGFATSLSAADLSGGYLPPDDASGGVRLGVLTCDIGSGGGYLLGSAKTLDCTFKSTRGRLDHYSGFVRKIGVDLGYTAGGKIAWAVFAPTAGYHSGSLGGLYKGLSAEATAGIGIGANLLVGGTNGSIQLQPLSVTGQVGLNVAAAATSVTLTPAG